MGYGYGIWLVVLQDQLKDFISSHNFRPFIPHITVQCNMIYDSAKKLFDDLKSVENIQSVKIISEFLFFQNDKYTNQDNLYAAGLYSEIPNWNSILHIVKKYQGTYPTKPHMSLVYRLDKKQLIDDCKKIKFEQQNPNLKNNIIDVKLALVDITSDNPKNWEILESN